MNLKPAGKDFFDRNSRTFLATATEFARRGARVVLADVDKPGLEQAVQRLGAGREKAGEPVDPHAGIEFHHRRGARVEKGQKLATFFATSADKLAESTELFKRAIRIAEQAPEPVPLVSQILTRAEAEASLQKSKLRAGIAEPAS